MVKHCDLRICNLAEDDVLKHVPAGSVRYTFILMLVSARIDLLKILRILQKLFAQPLRRNIPIGAVMVISPWLWYFDIFVRPIR